MDEKNQKELIDNAVFENDYKDENDIENETGVSKETDINAFQGVPENGWYKINKALMHDKGVSYPANMYFNMRTADTPEVKHWSTLSDEEMHPMEILKHFNYMLEKCVSVENGDWSDIKVKDRLWFIFYLHEISYVEAERPLIINCKCKQDECEHDFQAKIDRAILQYDKPDERVLKYLNPATGSYDVKTKDFGDITITLPSIKVDNALMNYMKEAKQNWVKENEAFFEIASYLIKPNVVPTAKVIESVYIDYKSWSKHKFLFIVELIKMCKVKPKDIFKVKCPKCGRETDQAFDLEGGIKALFSTVPNIFDQLL